MKAALIILFTLGIGFTHAQQISIHQEQLEQYNALGNVDAAYYEAIPNENSTFRAKSNCTLNKVVYGWHPYWVGNAYQNYDWNLLSHFSFFSYEVNASDGQPITTHGWSTSAAVDAALASGNTKVTLCVTLFSGHTTFFGNPTAQQTLISNLINLVQTRGADGVNIDFEGLPSSQATNFANFMVDLSNQMHAAIPGSEVSTVLYAVDWSNVFNFSIMEPVVDQYIIMGYDYYWSGSSNAGPTDPLYHFGSTYNYTLSRSITYYLDKGCPKSKLVLGLPYYGREWPTTSTSIPSATSGSGTSRTYVQVRNNTSGNYAFANHNWEGNAFSDNYTFNDGGTRQCFIMLDSAYRKRMEHVLNTGIAGIGIWALGYDDGYPELWNAMEDYMTDCYASPCSGTIHDFGGPTRNYYDDEDYTWTIELAGAISLDVDFTFFDVETNFDYLYVYDGNSTAAPQIAGSPFTGTTGPGQFTSSSGAVTFRFTSDGATVTPGFLANYTCNSVPPPTADFNVSNTTICLGDSIQLTNNSSDADTYLWSTSQGGLSSSTDENPYLYALTSGTYNITLTAFNAQGSNQSSQNIQITVESEPVASAIPNATQFILPSATLQFTNTSVNASAYFWDFDDGSTSVDVNPSCTYLTGGMYNVELVASNTACPSDTTNFLIEVQEAASFIETDFGAINVFPNPVADFVSISLPDNTRAEISILEANGKIVRSELPHSGGTEEFDVSDLANGTYWLNVRLFNQIYRIPLILVK